MAFTFSVNNITTDVNAAVLALKTKLKAAGWTVPESGDGLAAGGAASGDVLTTSTWLVAAQPNAVGTFQSWFRIVSPDGREMLWQANNGSHGDDWIVRYSPSLGFVGTDDGPVTTVLGPSALDEIIVNGTRRVGSNDGAPYGGLLGNAAQVWDYAIGGAAEDYAFYALGRTSPGGRYQGGNLYDRLTNAEGTDQDPTVNWFFGENVNGVGTYTMWNDAQVRELRWSATPKRSTFPGLLISPHISPVAFQRDPLVEPGAWSVMLGDLTTRAGSEVLNVSSFNVYDGNFDVMTGVDWFHQNHDATSLLPGGYNPGAPRGGFKGRSRLLAGFSGTGLNNMDTDTGETKVYQQGTYGALWILWDGATTPVL